MKTVTISKQIFIIFTALTCVLFSLSAYAQDLDVTMDVVQDPQKKDVTESMMNRIEMPEAAKQGPEKRGDKEHRNRERNGENMKRSGDNRNQKARENRNRIRDKVNDAKKDMDQSRDRDKERINRPDNEDNAADMKKQCNRR